MPRNRNKEELFSTDRWALCIMLIKSYLPIFGFLLHFISTALQIKSFLRKNVLQKLKTKTLEYTLFAMPENLASMKVMSTP